MKVKISNNGGFRFLDGVSFPFEVDAVKHPSIEGAVHVPMSGLINAGASRDCMILDAWSFAGDEFEVVE